MSQIRSNVQRLLRTLVEAINENDLSALTNRFADAYLNETPAHPSRGFRGSQQVRRNWAQIFGSIPDIRAHVLRCAVDGQTMWTEWEMSGTRADGNSFLMRGVVIFEITGTVIDSARFYLEPGSSAPAET